MPEGIYRQLTKWLFHFLARRHEPGTSQTSVWGHVEPKNQIGSPKIDICRDRHSGNRIPPKGLDQLER